MFYIAEFTPSHSEEYLAENPDLTQIEIVAGSEPHSASLQTCTGPYPSVTSAKQAIAANYGLSRTSKPNGEPFETYSRNAVFACKPGKLEPLGRNYTENWLRSNLGRRIAGATNRAEILVLAEETRAQLAATHSTPHPDLISLITSIHDGAPA